MGRAAREPADQRERLRGHLAGLDTRSVRLRRLPKAGTDRA
jgi:hypothetical protein